MPSVDPQELLRIERAVRKAVTAILENEMPIALAIRAAAVSLLQGLPDPAAALPRERPSERCTRQNQDALHQMALLEAEGRGRDAANIVARRQVVDPRDHDEVYRRSQCLRRLRRDQKRNAHCAFAADPIE